MDSSTRLPKQARAIRTRERILDQAEQAFADKGFEAASLTSDILDPAGISVGSFYHQFTDKRSVLHALLAERRTWHELVAAARAAADGRATCTDAVRAAMTSLLDAIDRHPATWWIHFRELHSADPEIRALITESWGAWHRAVAEVIGGRADGPVSPGRVGFVACGLVGVLHAYLVGDAAARRRIRTGELDDVAAGCAAALA